MASGRKEGTKMATISTRIDENLKTQAEEIADRIGIPLGTAINIFIRRFISERGFPFQVVANGKASPVLDETFLDETVRAAVADPDNTGKTPAFTYLDPKTKRLTAISREET